MDEGRWERIRGIKRLVHDGVGRGSRFVEKHHRHAAAKPFEVLGAVPVIGVPTRIVRGVHDAVLTVTYTSIRAVNEVTEVVDEWVVDRLEAGSQPTSDADPS
jgi:hypothetical protein